MQLAAEGAFLKVSSQKAKWFVRWNSDGRSVRPGPGIGIISIINNYFYYFYYFDYLHLSANIAQALNTMNIKERKQDVISFSMLFGKFLTSVLI